VHVTLRSGFKPLRSQFVFPTVRGAVAEVNRKACKVGGRFRVVHFSVQFDHVHLIVEAPNKDALWRGVRGLCISIARRVNRLVRRRGALFEDRWHGRALTSPRAVRHALVYVLANFRKHDAVQRRGGATADPYSSAPYFDQFAEYRGRLPMEIEPRLVARALRDEGSPVAAAGTWLLREGWLRHGRISVREAPRG
jgi:REP element-mobilizing transposase RayT